MLFFGLICGTIPELFKASEQSDPSKCWTPFVLSLPLAYLLFHLLENGIATAVAPSFPSYCAERPSVGPESDYPQSELLRPS